MNNRTMTLSLVMGILAAFFVYSYVSEIESNTQKKFGQKSFVIVAKEDIKEMTTLDESLFDLQSIPSKFQDPSAIKFESMRANGEEATKEDVARDLKKYAGLVALVRIRKGEQITFNKISDPGIRTGLAPQVTPGKRAIGIPVTEVSGVAKLLKPGDRVDLIGVLKLNDSGKLKVARTILQDILILSVGKYINNNIPRTVEGGKDGEALRIRSLNQYDGYTTVTVEVDLVQAQTISLLLADPDNKLTLALRNNDDVTTKLEPGVTSMNLYGPESERAQARYPASQPQQPGGGGAR